MDTQIPQANPKPSAGTGKKLLVLAVVAIVVGVAYTQFGDLLSLQNLARQETQLRSFQQSQPVMVYAGSSVPDLQTLADKGIGAVFSPSQMTQIIAAFVMLGSFPLIVRFVMKKKQ